MFDAKNVFQVDGIVAVITGGAGGKYLALAILYASFRPSNHILPGIGWMIAEALAMNGASKVFLLGRREHMLTDAAAKYPDIMVPVTCDVASKESLGLAVELVARTTGFINLLVANSGISGPANGYKSALSISELRSHLMATSMDEFTQTFRVNVTGTWFTMVAFLELLDAGNKNAISGSSGAFGSPVQAGSKTPSIQSQVVFTSSLAAFSRGYWTSPNYGSSKAAIIHLMKQASTNLAPYGIRANAIAPGRRCLSIPR